MFVDTSVVVALLADEPEAARFASKLADAKLRYTSGLVVLEAAMRLSVLLDVDPLRTEAAIQSLLDEAGITVVPISAGTARKAVAAFAAYGEGRDNAAQLSLSDCMAYACAQAYSVPLLFAGEAFAATNVRIA